MWLRNWGASAAEWICPELKEIFEATYEEVAATLSTKEPTHD